MLHLSHRVPELKTDFVEPLHFLEKHFLANKEKIRQWLDARWQQHSPPVYGSIDLRNAGFKLAPIDMNLFPAGFNNLNPEFLANYAKAAKNILMHVSPKAKKILLVPETHTRNTFYWENVSALKNILIEAGFDIRIASLAADVTESVTMRLQSEGELLIEPMQRSDGRLHVGDFMPDAILLNNDLSDGVPEILNNLLQPVFPPARLGWSHRLKSEHFQYFADVVNEFSQMMDIDPWLLSPLFRYCGEVDFTKQEGLECIVSNAEKLFTQIEEKYREYGVKEKPFLVIKADSGTYGMAVMTVRSLDEVRQLNRKQRNKMATIKGGKPVRRVIIQEGVYSFEVFPEENAVAEPVVYLFGGCVVGGFYRVHHQRASDESLNVPGMRFEPIPFAQACDEPLENIEPASLQNRLYIYGVVAQLSMLAASREIKEQVIT